MKTKASVKIMRSYDYNHFEVSLSTDELIDEKEVNSLRIKAAKLVDHAIEQYKKKKSAEAYSANNTYMRAELERKVKAYLELEKEIIKLKKSREWLRKACEFYASSDQWNCTKEQLTTYNTIDKDDLGIGDFQFACDVDDDRVGGKKAREALEADDEIMK